MSEANANPSLGPNAVHAYLLQQIGTANAWRTAAELAREMGANTPRLRDNVAKSLWQLNRLGMIIRRLRAGSGHKECMAVQPERAARVDPIAKPKPPRVEIRPPADVPVLVRVPLPPPVSPEAIAAVEKLVHSPTPSLTLADVLAKHKARIEAPAPAVESGPLEDNTGPIASEAPVDAPPTLDIKAECAAIAERCGSDEDASESPELADELRAFGELVERGKREPPAILYRDTKIIVLRDLAALAPPLTAYYLREIAADLDRVGA